MSVKISDSSITAKSPLDGTEHVPINNSGSKGKALISAILDYIRQATVAFTVASVNKVTITAPAAGSTLTIADGKTLAASASLTLAGTDGKTLTVAKNLTLDGTDGTTMTFPTTSATIARTDQSQAFTGNHSFSGNLSVAGAVNSSGATNGIGYTTGAGGTVTQLTDKTTGVTLSKVIGAITMNNAALADATTVTFTVTNTACASSAHFVAALHKSGGTAGAYLVWAHSPSSNSFKISVRNISGGSLSEAIVITFIVFNGVVA